MAAVQLGIHVLGHRDAQLILQRCLRTEPRGTAHSRDTAAQPSPGHLNPATAAPLSQGVLKRVPVLGGGCGSSATPSCPPAWSQSWRCHLPDPAPRGSESEVLPSSWVVWIPRPAAPAPPAAAALGRKAEAPPASRWVVLSLARTSGAATLLLATLAWPAGGATTSKGRGFTWCPPHTLAALADALASVEDLCTTVCKL